LRLPLRIRIENQLAQLSLRCGIGDRAQQREAAAFAVDVVLPRGERDVAAAASAPIALPNRKANQLEAFERPFAEMELGVGELSGRIASVVWRYLDCNGDCSLSAGGPDAERSFTADAVSQKSRRGGIVLKARVL